MQVISSTAWSKNRVIPTEYSEVLEIGPSDGARVRAGGGKAAEEVRYVRGITESELHDVVTPIADPV